MDIVRLILVEPELQQRALVAQAIHATTAFRGVGAHRILDEVETLKGMADLFDIHEGPYELAVVNIDLCRPGEHIPGGEVLAALVRRFPLVPFVGYSASDSPLTARRAFEAGASGFFRRDSPSSQIQQAVDLVLGAEAFAVPEHFRSRSLSC